MKKSLACVYILTNSSSTMFYAGITTDLTRRILEHKKFEIEGYSKKFATDRLVYYETHASVINAIERYHTIYNGTRRLKMALVRFSNPGWMDLSEELGILEIPGFTQITSNRYRSLDSRAET